MLISPLTLSGNRTYMSKDGGVDGIRFDGVVDALLLEGQLNGTLTGQTWTFAFRYRSFSNTTARIWNNQGETLSLRQRSDEKIELFIENTAGAKIYNLITADDTFLYDDLNYHTFLLSIDFTAPKVNLMYIDDAQVTLTPTTFTEGGTMDIAADVIEKHAIGATTAIGPDKWNGDFTFLFGGFVFYDFTQTINRRLFFDASGSPVLSPTGNGTPAGGVQPLLYFAGKVGQWHINKGTDGQTFTVIGAPTSPPN